MSTIKQLVNTALCLLGAGVFSSAHAQVTPYSLIDLGTLGGERSLAYGLNNAGQVVGWSETNDGGEHAFLWNGSVLVDLHPSNGQSYGASYAYGINEPGQVVGSLGERATVWNRGTAVDLGTLAGPFSSAYGINSGPQVVGWSCAADDCSVRRAFFWNGGAPIDLGTLGGPDSHAYGINDARQVVGWSYVATTPGNFAQHATLWEGGAITDLGTLGGLHSYALGINNSGQVVGWSYTTDDAAWHATLWENGTLIDLGSLGGTESYAYDINEAGHAVGESLISGDSGSHAFFWNGSTLIDLNTLLDSSGAGWTLESAQAINDAGQIAGYGKDSLGRTHAVLLTPVPEPETFAMMLVGLGLLGWLRSRNSSKQAAPA
jgi:probable HAF family extracellular repeat protein